MRFSAWLAMTERALDVVRIALDEARKAKEYETPVPPPPEKPRAPAPAPTPESFEKTMMTEAPGYAPKYVLVNENGDILDDTGGFARGIAGIARREWNARDEVYSKPRGMALAEVVYELNHAISELEAYGHFEDRYPSKLDV